MKPKIVAVHLLNDFSGSPMVLSQALKGLQKSGHEVVIHTAGGREGFLSDIDCKKEYFTYRFYQNPIMRLIAFLFSQVVVFSQLMRYRKENVVIYVNTLLPFGAALAGKFMGKKVVYHIHESYIKPIALKRFLKGVASVTADTAVYVSNYLCEAEKIENIKHKVVYNALPDEFVLKADGFKYHIPTANSFTVLMVCSLKEYKGINEFIALAKRHPKLKFEMVLNAEKEDITNYFTEKGIPSNVSLFPTQKNLDPFYRRASLLLNLTNPQLCVETFGMTILEAMCYGIPVIAPPVGGPAEIVDPGENGFTIDVREETRLDLAIEKLYADGNMLSSFSSKAKETSAKFNSSDLQGEIVKIISLM